jgi:hypothetical protein
MEKPMKGAHHDPMNRKRQGLADETDAELTTAKLAGPSQPTARAANVESLVEANSRPEEIAAGPVASHISGTESPATAAAPSVIRFRTGRACIPN